MLLSLTERTVNQHLIKEVVEAEEAVEAADKWDMRLIQEYRLSISVT